MLFIVADVIRYPRLNLYIQTIHIYTDIVKREVQLMQLNHCDGEYSNY